MQLINIPYDRGIRLVEAHNIIRVEGQSNYSKIYFTSGYPLTVAKVLHWFEEKLPGEMFARVHRRHLVNKLFMQEINGAGFKNLVLSNGENITMSRRKKLVSIL